MKLSIIILNFNTPQFVLSCVESLIKNYHEELVGKEFEVLIFDNGSRDDSVKILKKNYAKSPFVHIFASQKNLGFGKGINEAAKKAQGKYLLFLNSDTVVEDKGLIGMVSFLDTHTNVGVLGGKLENTDDTPQKSAGSFYTLFNVMLMLLGGERLGLLRYSPNMTVPVDWVSGAAMMVGRELFATLSGFDNEIFMYMEDMELCFRASRLGREVYFFPDIRIKHRGHGSSNRAFAVVNIYDGILYFYRKHMPQWQYKIVSLLLKIKAHTLSKIGTITGNRYLAETYEKALTVC